MAAGYTIAVPPKMERSVCHRFVACGFRAVVFMSGVLAWSLFSQEAYAQSGCDDLDSVPETPAVDFETQIQPIFTNTCVGCHNQFHQTGLDLRSGESYALLVNVPSTQDGKWLRVDSSGGETGLANSLLFHKVNCNDPKVGARMPLGGQPLSLQQQALFRDWIEQGALEEPPAPETFSIGGMVNGLEGAGLVLQNNGSDDLPINEDGPFTFATELEDGDSYQVTVFSQPADPSQTCTVSNGDGKVSGDDVTDVEVTCVTVPPDTFTISGTVSGLEGAGLMLQNNGGDDLAIAEDGPFTFATELPQGVGYEVTVFMQPEDPEQFCMVENGTGVMPAADVDDIEVECFDQDPDVFEDRFEVQ